MKRIIIAITIIISIFLLCFGIHRINYSYELSESRYNNEIESILESQEIVGVSDKQYLMKMESFCFGNIILGVASLASGIGFISISYAYILYSKSGKPSVPEAFDSAE